LRLCQSPSLYCDDVCNSVRGCKGLQSLSLPKVPLEAVDTLMSVLVNNQSLNSLQVRANTLDDPFVLRLLEEKTSLEKIRIDVAQDHDDTTREDRVLAAMVKSVHTNDPLCRIIVSMTSEYFRLKIQQVLLPILRSKIVIWSITGGKWGLLCHLVSGCKHTSRFGVIQAMAARNNMA